MATNLAPILGRALKYRSIGPYRGGRVVAVAGHPTDPQIYYFGSTGGGVWKTDDGGITWGNVSDGFFQRASVGALAVAASDPNVIYAGMGETTIRSNVTLGDGVYKSTDGGATWKHLGLAGTQQIAEIRIHPTDPDTVYVPNVQFWKSVDGGRTFASLATPHPDHHDLWIDPANPQLMIHSADGGAAVSGNGGFFWTNVYNRPTVELYHVTTDSRFPYRVYGAQQDNTTISVPSRSAKGVITQAEY